MIRYVVVGTDDLGRAGRFYDEILALIGAERARELERFITWSNPEGGTSFGVTVPRDGQPARPGNGLTISLSAPTPAVVDAIHAKALELGGTDEGSPGPRHDGSYYAAYFRDLDGNKLNALCLMT